MRAASPLTLTGRRLVAGLALLLAGALLALETGGGGAAPAVAGADGDVAEPPSGDGATTPGSGGGAPGSEEAGEALASWPVRVHVVEPGETAGEIAERHGVRTSALTRANRHVRAEALQPGTRLAVPDPEAPRPGTPQEAMAADPELDALFDEVAQAYGWTPATVKAVAWVESRWDHHVISDRGAIGVLQVQPATGELMAGRIGRPLDLHDLRDNVEAGVAYLDFLHDRYGNDTRALLAAYHQGPQALRDHGIYRISDRYADQVLGLREVFRSR